MTPVLGAFSRVYCNGFDVGPSLKSGEIARSCDAKETTRLNVTDRTYRPGLGTGQLSAGALFEGDEGEIDEILSAALGASPDSLWCVFPIGENAIGDIGYAMVGIGTKHDISIPVEELVETSAEAQASGGVERIRSLHPMAAETTTGAFTALDNAAATDYGGAVYLQVIGLNGASAVVRVEHSSDNFASDVTTLATFETVTEANIAERIPVTGTIKRYVRARLPSGTFTSITFSVGINRKQSAA